MTGRTGVRQRLARRQLLVALLVAGLVAALATLVAAAHADLVASEPAAGSTVIGSPGTIRLSFSQPLQKSSTIQVFTGQFEPVTGLAISVAGSELQAVIGKSLSPATYTVQWTAVSDDGHSAEGSYQFAVVAGDAAGSSRLAPFAAMLIVVIGFGVVAAAWLARRRRRV